MKGEAVKLDKVLKANRELINKTFEDPLTKPDHIKVSEGDKFNADIYRRIYRYSFEIWYLAYHKKIAENYRNRAMEFIKLGMYDQALEDTIKASE